MFNQEITIRLDEPADPRKRAVTILKLTQVILKGARKGHPAQPAYAGRAGSLLTLQGLRITILKELGKFNHSTVDHKHNCALNKS